MKNPQLQAAYEAMRETAIRRLTEGSGKLDGSTKESRLIMSWLFEENLLLGVFNVRDKAISMNLSPADFLMALVSYQAIEASIFMTGSATPEGAIEATSALAGVYRLDLTKHVVSHIGNLGRLPADMGSPEGMRIKKALDSVRGSIRADMDRIKEDEEADKPT